VFLSKKAFTRAYEAWEPREPWGEEVFPDCPEGDEARECLRSYQRDDYPPAFLESQRNARDAEMKRKDSISPSVPAPQGRSRFAGLMRA
jgi:hypothetical protein